MDAVKIQGVVGKSGYKVKWRARCVDNWARVTISKDVFILSKDGA